MKSVTSAILSAAVLGQVSSAFTLGSHAHAHTHVHSKRSVNVSPLPEFWEFMEPKDIKYIDNAGIKLGLNKPVSSGEAVAVGQGGDYTVELNNKGTQDIIVVAWSGKTAGQWGAVEAGFVGVAQADITHTLKANTTTWFSYSPTKKGGDISGALAPIYPGGGLTSFSGQVNDVWVEFTFTKDNSFATTDVSKIINMDGHKVEVHNYASKDAQSKGTAACSTTAGSDLCAYVCPTGVKNCIVGKLINCPAGASGNTASYNGMDGGCGGLPTKGGVIEVNFF